jgi:lipopolysaccharide export system protein LptA
MIRPLAASLLLAALPPSPVLAQAIDLSSGGPVQVTARGGFEWQQNDQKVIATGDARAVRGNVTVLADQLIAYYRKKQAGATAGATTTAATTTGAASPQPQDNGSGAPDEGGSEVYRLEAVGHVRILTPTDEAVGDHAVYDIDQAVLVLTGKHMKLTTPNDVLTARDTMEYWSQLHMAVGRGNAVVVTNDGRRIAADTLVAYTQPDQPGTAAGATKAAAPAPAPGKPGEDPLAAQSGKLKLVEAFGNVDLRTQVDTVLGDRGVYVPETGIARIVGHVRVTHGDNQINGPAADVNMKTGIAHITSAPGAQVHGLIMPKSAEKADNPDSGLAK